MQTHQTTIARNIPSEMAEYQREAGRSLTKREFVALGLTEQQVDKHAPEAARLFALAERKRAA